MKRFKQIPNDMSLNLGLKFNKYLGTLGAMPDPEKCEEGDFFLFPDSYVGVTPVGGQLYYCEDVVANLKKCPFCGEEARLVVDSEFDTFAVECANCLTISMWFKTKEEAAEAWNRRV